MDKWIFKIINWIWNNMMNEFCRTTCPLNNYPENVFRRAR